MVPETIRRLVAMALSVLGLLAFAFIYVVVAIKGAAFIARYPNLEYVGTALAGLVGGFVAAAFGQKYPAAQPRAATPEAAPSRFRVAAHSLGSYARAAEPQAVTGAPLSVTDWVGTAYIIVYFVVGILAAIVWVLSSAPPEMVKNLAMIVLGLAVAIIGSTLRS